MNSDKVKEALIMGLNAVESAGWTRSQEKEAQEIREALAELEKPAKDDVLQLASRWVLSSIDTESLAYDIQQYAESYHAKKCAKCDHTVWCEFCGDPITIGVCENCVPDMFNDDNTLKTGCNK